MGTEIVESSFTEADFVEFRRRVVAETERLERWEAEQRFSHRGAMAGFELEAWLVDSAMRPAPENAAFLERMDNPLVVPELSCFNVELNGSPTTLHARAFTRLENELDHTWQACQRSAEDMGVAILMAGVLPTVTPDDLTMDHISSLSRYAALNSELLKARDGRPFELRIDGHEKFRRTHPNLMLEAAATSFQIHLQVRAEDAARLYNAAQAAAGPMLVAAANSPYLFGRDLWAESRIPLFEQSVNAGGIEQRVGFGNEWLADSLLELFEANLERHVVLLPQLFEDGPDKVSHLRLHNGTIWRWNRPLVGFDHDGLPHLRIEHRVVPAGPTIRDAIANAALFYGMVSAFFHRPAPIESEMPFEHAKENFYEAARHGIDAQLHWPGSDGLVSGRQLLLDELLPAARKGLERMRVTDADGEEYLDVIRDRLAHGLNGAAWQRRWVERHGRDLSGLTAAMLERQRTGIPVHRWTI